MESVLREPCFEAGAELKRVHLVKSQSIEMLSEKSIPDLGPNARRPPSSCAKC
jgi:hypothetical protein